MSYLAAPLPPPASALLGGQWRPSDFLACTHHMINQIGLLSLLYSHTVLVISREREEREELGNGGGRKKGSRREKNGGELGAERRERGRRKRKEEEKGKGRRGKIVLLLGH